MANKKKSTIKYPPSAKHLLGAKEVEGKPRMTLVSHHLPRALLAVAELRTHAAANRGDSTWEEVTLVEWQDAMQRHQNAIAQGEYWDEDSGFRHSTCILCTAMFIDEINARAEEAEE